MKEAFRFTANSGMSKASFHSIHRLDWYLLDKINKVTIPSVEAIKLGMVSILVKNYQFTEFRCKDEFVMVSVSQKGFKIPTYISRYIMKLGGDTITRIDSFKKTNQTPLFFEAEGEILRIGEIIKYGLEFACETNKTAPRVIANSVVTSREKGMVVDENSRSIHILKTT